ncbi:MAG TPA: CPBP family intramembrane glutamic endopeptidase [Anaerolineales bacterium]|nr:CPBP family intramembrane glutamic endopeptidase [Anaerolineales bacterium]
MFTNTFHQIFSLRWNPNRDVAAVFASWVLVTGTLYTATVIVTTQAGGGFTYFLLYAVLAATLFGVGIPVAWMVVYRKRPIRDLGITTRYLGISILLQFIFSAVQYLGTLARVDLPAIETLLPLGALALAIGFFEALFWRGWVLLRLEEAFGLIPAILLGSLLYALYHIGYGMPLSEIVFLFWIGVMYAVCFRLTRNIFVLWPLFQPMGQLVTLLRDGLPLPMIAALGFFEVLLAMLVLVWLLNRYYRKHHATVTKGQVAASA